MVLCHTIQIKRRDYDMSGKQSGSGKIRLWQMASVLVRQMHERRPPGDAGAQDAYKISMCITPLEENEGFVDGLLCINNSKNT